MLKFKQFLTEATDNTSYFSEADKLISFSSIQGITLEQVYSKRLEFGKIDLFDLYYRLTDNVTDPDKKKEIRNNVSKLEMGLSADSKKYALECQKILRVAESLLLAEAKKFHDYVVQKINDYKNQNT